MLKRLLMVTLVCMFVAGLSGFAYGLSYNLSNVHQGAGDDNEVWLVHQMISDEAGGSYNDSGIEQTGNGNYVGRVWQEICSIGSYNESNIDESGHGNSVYLVSQYVDADGSYNESNINQSGDGNVAGHTWQINENDSRYNLSNITQTGGWNTVMFVVQIL